MIPSITAHNCNDTYTYSRYPKDTHRRYGNARRWLFEQFSPRIVLSAPTCSRYSRSLARFTMCDTTELQYEKTGVKLVLYDYGI